MIRAHQIVTPDRMIELDHGGAAVARMQLDAEIIVVPDHVGDADAERLRVAAAPLRIVAVEDHYVAAVTAGTLEKPPGSRIGFDRRHDLEKARADRKQRVDQAVFRDGGIAMADLDPENRPDVFENRFEPRRDKANLPDPQVITNRSASLPRP